MSTYKIPNNPLESNPLFAASEEPKTKKQTSAKKTTKPAVSPKPEKQQKPAEKKSDSPALLNQISESDEDTTYRRATFIVREDLLTVLRDLAYTDREELKKTVNTALRRGLQAILDEHQAEGKPILHRED